MKVSYLPNAKWKYSNWLRLVLAEIRVPKGWTLPHDPRRISGVLVDIRLSRVPALVPVSLQLLSAVSYHSDSHLRRLRYPARITALWRSPGRSLLAGLPGDCSEFLFPVFAQDDRC